MTTRSELLYANRFAGLRSVPAKATKPRRSVTCSAPETAHHRWPPYLAVAVMVVLASAGWAMIWCAVRLVVG